jgi:endogenous inhibitor of DNA gyrase (YacG/DUF329 family)
MQDTTSAECVPEKRNNAAGGGEVSMVCDHCGSPFAATRRQHRFCSARCRAAAFQVARGAKQAERDAEVRLLLRTAREALEEADARLRAKPDPSGAVARHSAHTRGR